MNAPQLNSTAFTITTGTTGDGLAWARSGIWRVTTWDRRTFHPEVLSEQGRWMKTEEMPSHVARGLQHALKW